MVSVWYFLGFVENPDITVAIIIPSYTYVCRVMI